jgi:hypothetical protein
MVVLVLLVLVVVVVVLVLLVLVVVCGCCCCCETNPYTLEPRARAYRPTVQSVDSDVEHNPWAIVDSSGTGHSQSTSRIDDSQGRWDVVVMVNVGIILE